MTQDTPNHRRADIEGCQACVWGSGLLMAGDLFFCDQPTHGAPTVAADGGDPCDHRDIPPLTDEQIAEINLRCMAATEGPWKSIVSFHGSVNASPTTPSEDAHRIEGPRHPVCDGTSRDTWECLAAGLLYTAADAALLAHSRDDIPALLATVHYWRTRAESPTGNTT